MPRNSSAPTCRRAANSYVQVDVTVAPPSYDQRVKICIACGQSKPLDQFYRAAGMADGHRSDCIQCNLAAKRARTALDPEANRARARRWKQENPERARAKQREYLDSGQKQIWDRQSYLKRKYGITIDDYDHMFEKQRGVCAICGEPRPEERTLHVDHDHLTGAVRGLLCFRCNNSLGDLRDDRELVQRAADYLDRDDELAALVRGRVGALRG
jgi:hypothetical protein